MSLLKILLFTLAGSAIAQNIALGMSLQKDASERVAVDETRQILLKIRHANRISVLLPERRQDVSVGAGQKKVSIPPVMWEQDLGDLKDPDRFFHILNRMECKPSLPCLCSGQPYVKFYHDKDLLLTIRVKHDDNVEIAVPGGAHSYRTGARGIVEQFYLLLQQLFPSNTADVEIANVLSVAMKSDVTPIPEEVRKDQQQRQAEALSGNVDAVRNLNVPVVAPLP